MALNNPNYYRRLNRAQRSGESQQKAAGRKALRAQFRNQYGNNWSQNASARSAYEAEASRMGISAKEMVAYVTSGRARATDATTRKQRAKARRAMAKAEGFSTYGKGSKALAYKFPKKRMTVTTKTGKKRVVVDANAVQAYNAARLGRKAALAYWQGPASAGARANPGSMALASRDIWGQYAGGSFNYKTGQPKGSGTLITRAQAAGGKWASLLPDHEYAVPRSERKRQGKKAAKTRAARGIAAFGGKAKRYPKGVTPPQFAERQALLARARAAGIKGAGRMKNPELMAVLGRSNPSYRPPIGSRQYNQDTKAHYRAKHALTNGLALDNYGALALDNYGGLALENPVPFVGGVAANTGLLLVTGLAGGIGHAFLGDKVEGLLAKIPVVGERLMDLSIPEAVPVIGGMSLDNTIVGAVTGIGLIAAAQFLGRRTGMRHITEYGTALGTGVIIAGPVLDFAGAGSNSGDDLAGLALENEGTFGGLALENEGTFGDGMAYQIGSIVGDDSEYDQASLADAFYSGADFDVAEGQAILNGRAAFQQRFGHAPRRVDVHGGRRSGPSHLASRPGHRWGWLIKMIGFENVQKLAALPPQKRVSVLKQMQSSAVATFQQLMAEQKVAEIAAPELAPEGAQGADGVNGLFGAYGATVFGGAGL